MVSGTRLQSPGMAAIDSRKLSPGDVFWALPGEHADGADFIDHAFARGAAGAVTERRGLTPPPDRWLIEVDNVQQSLERLATWHRQRFAGTVIAVTGSVGKTTCRELIRTAISARFGTLASPGNYNNHLGLPLSVLGLRQEHAFAVFELGASAEGEIAQLAALCRPHWGAITSLADAHLMGFGSSEGLVAAKTELVPALPCDGYLVLNGDDQRLRRWFARTRHSLGIRNENICWVGRTGDCDLRAERVRYAGGRLQFFVEGVSCSLPLAGRHFVNDALVALAMARRADVPLREAAEALTQFDPPPLRCEISRQAGVTIINDAYNACPASMHAALQLLRDTPVAGRRVALLGDMRELGTKAQGYHTQLGKRLLTVAGVDAAFICGDWAQTVAHSARQAGLKAANIVAAPTAEELWSSLTSFLRPGDAVLVKASRALALDVMAKNLKKVLSQAAKRHSLASETLIFSLPVAGMKTTSTSDAI